MENAAPAGAPPSLGATCQPGSRGARIFSVRPGGPADRAGLGRDDLLISIDNQPLAREDLAERLKPYPPGASVIMAVERHGRQETIEVALDPPDQDSYSIEELDGATAEQLAIRNRWLNGK